MCTGIRLQAKDKSTVYGRTLEFGRLLQSHILFIPRNYALAGTTPDHTQGITWKTKHAAVGMNESNVVALIDGINEKGLAGGLFYFPDYAGYQIVSPIEYQKSLAPWEILTYLLTTCATIQEVEYTLTTVFVAPVIFSPWGIIPPVHLALHDSTGASLIIEYRNGKVHVFHNDLGVVANAPQFEWHMTNLHNYSFLTPYNHSSITLNTMEFMPLGQGSGMRGIPGDFTSPSRFVRAAFYSATVIEKEDSAQTVDTAFRILNLFNIPRGVIREIGQKIKHGEYYDHTQWTTVCELKAKQYHYFTYSDKNIRTVELLTMNLTDKEIRLFPLT